ncbi:RlpA-like double-psi beta-barrel domain-containing protein [Paenibacillus durus]|uniref:3D domain-containing protein n=1 Tax=Paenibacillus durus ATCC 35681 TaxID=1333534 RepID=A0A0F7CI31_PAEDU|nr:hypothetical protein [Paenibacillus durus]AKG34986.1 hypothetical protein VK70_10770 [Paenibacillus durus ATCC 35681]
MKLLKVVSGAALSSAMLLTIASGAFAQASSPVAKEASDVSVTLDGKTTTFSSAEIDRLAAQNNVDANALRKAIESGPDEERRFSPFSKLPQLKNKGITTQEQLDQANAQRLSSTGEPLVKSKAASKSSSFSALSTISKTNQDSTAYNWTGNQTANGNWPALGICAVHRQIDIGGSTYAPVIPFGKLLSTNKDIWLPDGVGYKSDFTVDDTGSGPNRTAYWIDIYYHNDTQSAINYGVIKLDYTYTS